MNEKVAAQARVASEVMTVVKQQEQLVSCVLLVLLWVWRSCLTYGIGRTLKIRESAYSVAAKQQKFVH